MGVASFAVPSFYVVVFAGFIWVKLSSDPVVVVAVASMVIIAAVETLFLRRQHQNYVFDTKKR